MQVTFNLTGHTLDERNLLRSLGRSIQPGKKGQPFPFNFMEWILNGALSFLEAIVGHWTDAILAVLGFLTGRNW